MTPAALLVVLVGLALVAYVLGKSRALAAVGGPRGIRNLHSLPSYYGVLTALWCALPALVVLAAWGAFQDTILIKLVLSHMPAAVQSLPESQLGLVINDVHNVIAGNVSFENARPEVRAAAEQYIELRGISRYALTALVLAIGIIGIVLVRSRISPEFRARNAVEKIVEWALIGCSLIAVLTTIGIIASVAFEAARFFSKVPWYEFVFGTVWSPQTAIRADQVGSSGSFGAVPLFAGTALISGIAMLISVPVGLFSAIYLSEYAHRSFRAWTKPFLEVLAGIPTVVYGFFAALTVGPLLRTWGEALGLQVASESALAAGLVMGIMIVPFVSSLADDMITAVPQALRDGAYALGATKSETIKQVVVRAALPGIVGGVLLAISRAIGETMIVVMAAGLAANLTANPFEAVTTVTVQIVTLLVGDQEFDSPKTLAAFALGLVLFLVTLALNVLALHIVKKYREQYE
ncbi:MAG TPA: phosphate ABC transporter permease subunit PstC [Steroidobacteraceae bacterium]|jgi:phosphate transport system permease protein|nr:phosphate ABC transporter permease subunit PstC [Steroidobacteraceae bacterium]